MASGGNNYKDVP